MGDVKVSLRLPYELAEAIQAAGENASELMRDALSRQFLGGVPKIEGELSERVVDKAVRSAMSHIGGFSMPVGDVICKDTSPQSQLWWCPEERIASVAVIAHDWEDGGFKFKVGSPGCGSWYMPDVIESLDQERRSGARFCPSCRGIEARVGDKLVWLEITKPKKALEYMKEHANIPCAVRCDIHKYSDDAVYREAFDMANELFIYYANNGRPRHVSTEPMSKSEFCEMYDL